MPFLHIDEDNEFKENWCKKLGETYIPVEWNLDKDKYYNRLFYPEIDIDIFPALGIRTFTGLAKLYDYGGIVVIGREVKPIPGIENLDFKTITKLSISKSQSLMKPEFVNVIIAPVKDEICLKYVDMHREYMVNGIWKYIKFSYDNVNTF